MHSSLARTDFAQSCIQCPKVIDIAQFGPVQPSPSRTPSPHPHSGTEGPRSWLSPASLTTAVEDAVPVAAHTVCHLVGKGGGTTRLIEDICSVIVAVGDRGDGEAYIALFGPEQRMDAARVIVEAVARGAWSLPHCLKEHGCPIG